MTKTDTHDWDLGSLHKAAQVVNGLLAMGWVTRSIGDEDTIEVMSDLVNREVVWEDSSTGSTTNQASQDVLLNTAIDDSNVHIAIVGADMERRLGANLLDQIDLLRVDESLVLIGIVFLANCDSGKGRSDLSQVCDNGTGIDARDGRDTLTSTPFAQALDSSPVAILLSIVCNHHTNTLDIRGLEVLQKSVVVSSRGRNAIVADERLGENEDLSAV
jgi:hypothetical protein